MTSMASTDTAPRDRVKVLGLPIDRVTMDQALSIIEQFIVQGTPHIVVTADSSGIVQTQTDPEWKEIFQSADLVTPDSIGVVWAAKRAGKPVKDRVSGVDMVDQICRLSALKGYRIVFLGAEPGVAEMAAEALRLRHPGCNIVHARHGYFPASSDSVVAEELAEFKPDVLFVAMGIPRQEKFIHSTQLILKAPVAMGVGGSFDVFSGKTKRAPRLIQKLKLEWLWRTLLNPSKIKKAKALPKFAWLVLRSKR